jgi:hypothetical protein
VGGGGTVLAGEAGPVLEGLGGGGGALPGVVGGGGTFLLGACADCKLERGGMAGTGRDMVEEAGRTGGETLRAGRAGDGRKGGAGGAGGLELRTGGGALRGGGGALIGGSGTVREGRPSARRLGGAGDGMEGLGEGTDLLGGDGAIGVEVSRLGMEGGLPNTRGFASKKCEYRCYV